MACSHPFFDIDDILDSAGPSLDILWHFLVWIRFLCSFQVAPEVLQQGDLLLEVLWVLSESVLLSDVLSVGISSLHVVEVEAIGVEADLGAIVEEYTGSLVAQAVPEAVL